MEILSIIALVMLVLVGYSGGSVLGGRYGSAPPPGLIDLGVVVALWAGVFLARPELGRWWSIGAGVGAGLLAGALATAARRRSIPVPAQATTGLRRVTAGGWLAGASGKWRDFAQALGNYQGRLIMAFLYFGVVTPFALIGSRTRRLNAPRTPGTLWLQRAPAAPTLHDARRQF